MRRGILVLEIRFSKKPIDKKNKGKKHKFTWRLRDLLQKFFKC